MKNLTFCSLLIFCSISFTSLAQTSISNDFNVTNLNTFSQVWNLDDLVVDDVVELEDIYFEADVSDVSMNSMESLEAFANFLKSNPQIEVEVRGHTNGIPPHKYCDELSQARAQSVVDQLLVLGVDQSQMTAMGYGKRIPRHVEVNSIDRKSNQRVDVKFLSL